MEHGQWGWAEKQLDENGKSFRRVSMTEEQQELYDIVGLVG
jgi:hypothetical protein